MPLPRKKPRQTRPDRNAAASAAPREIRKGGAYIGVRVPSDLKARLEASARAAGRSTSSESQFRIERSYDRQALLKDVLVLAYGPAAGGLGALVCELARPAGDMALRETRPPRRGEDFRHGDWLSDPYAFDQVARAITYALDLLRPPGDPTPPPPPAAASPAFRGLEADRLEHLGRTYAHRILYYIADPAPPLHGEDRAWSENARDLLGPIADRLSALRTTALADAGLTEADLKPGGRA